MSLVATKPLQPITQLPASVTTIRMANKTSAAPSPPPPPPVTKPENMLPILIVLGVMFVGICIAMNLFSRARFKKQRSRAFASAAVASGPRAATPAARRSASSTPKPLGAGQRLYPNHLPHNNNNGSRSANPSPQPSRCASTTTPDTSRHHSITLGLQGHRSGQYRERSQEDKV